MVYKLKQSMLTNPYIKLKIKLYLINFPSIQYVTVVLICRTIYKVVSLGPIYARKFYHILSQLLNMWNSLILN